MWTQQSKRKSNFEIYRERDIDIYLGCFFRFFVGFGFWVSFVRLFENDSIIVPGSVEKRMWVQTGTIPFLNRI